MNYSLLPSLKHRTLVKISVELWNQNIRDLVARSSYYPDYTIENSLKEWQVVEDKVIEKVQNLPLPELLKKEVSDLVQPIGLEILKWKDCHKYHFGHCLDTGLSAEFCWTPHGTVDQKKTAEIWLKDESVDIITRYELACIYCFEDDVKELWNSMTQSKKEDFNEKHGRFWGIPDTTIFFSYCIKGEFSILNDLFGQVIPSPYADAFQDSACKGNKVATEYFLQKLTLRERDECMVKAARSAAHICGTLLNKYVFSTAKYILYANPDIDFPLPRECYADVVCFLLSQMNEEQQVKVFKKPEDRTMNEEQARLFESKDSAAEVLSCLLVWPWQRFFMQTANRVWDLLSEKRYLILLCMIDDKIRDGYKDYNYRQLFIEFWQQSPSAYKEFVVGGYTSRDSLLEFLRLKIERLLD